LKKISHDNGIVKTDLGWNGFNILHRDVGRINALEVGISPKLPANPPKVVILLGADNNLDVSLIPKDAFVIYIGHTGDEGAYYADLVLPSAAYTEKDATYVNGSIIIFNRYQLRVEFR
jgi:NADH dehydrogenase (ubiquinone) Fe-S protein 1